MLLGFGLLPALIQLLTLPWCPESPSRLASKGLKVEANKALLWLQGDTTPTSELATLRTNHKDDEPSSDVQTISIIRLMTSRLTLAPLLVTCCVMLAQQFSGINAVMFYSTGVFRSAGLKQGEQARYATLGMYYFNFLLIYMFVLYIRINLRYGCCKRVGYYSVLVFGGEIR